MAVTSGFFNSQNGDRMYNAEDVGRMMEGIFTDGILNDSRDSKFVVTHGSGLNVIVGSGKGWFKNTWIRNDDNITLTAEANTLGAARIDTVAIDVNLTDSVRANSIIIVKGTTSRPTLANSAAHKQYPLADITIASTGNDITGVVDRRDEIYSTSPLVIKPYYPVGAIYMSVNNIEPDRLFGGTWEQISGRFLIGCEGESGLSNGQTGGSWYHTIDVNNLPSHTHYINFTTNGVIAEITTLREDDNTTGNTVMGWPQQTDGLSSLETSNYLPASWNYPYGYQGVGAGDQEPVVGRAPYATSQTRLTQTQHYHSVSGWTDSAGNSNAMEIRPPYLAVYMWKRVS